LGLKEAKERFEMSLVAAALKRNQGNVSLAAKALKTSRSVVYNLIQKYGLKQQMEDKLVSSKLMSFS
jgi:DNA-binding NtrC family response regulator